MGDSPVRLCKRLARPVDAPPEHALQNIAFRGNDIILQTQAYSRVYTDVCAAASDTIHILQHGSGALMGLNQPDNRVYRGDERCAFLTCWNVQDVMLGGGYADDIPARQAELFEAMFDCMGC